ncbi:MAG: hypothetical protein AAGN82_12030 [Myxococcota bacterium]
MTNPMAMTREALFTLHERSRAGAVGHIPSKEDRLAERLAQHFLRLPATAQDEVRSLVSVDFGRVLLVFGSRLAVWAARTKDRNKLVAAVTLHAIEDFRFDARENYREFSIIGDACERVGMTTAELWDQTKHAFAGSSLNHAMKVAAPAPLSTMGLVASYEDGHLDYRPLR